MPFLYDATTDVHWDLQDFPVPVGRCVESFRKNITKVLHDLGYRGSLGKMSAYPSYDNMSTEVDGHFSSSEVCLYERRKTKFERLMRILTSMLSVAREHDSPCKEYNFLVIAKGTPDDGDKEFAIALSALITLGCNVFLAVPDGLPLAEMPPPSMASRVWYWSDLFDGKSPIQRIGVVEPDSPWEIMQKQYHLENLPLSDGSGDDTCDMELLLLSDGGGSDFSVVSSDSDEEEEEEEEEEEDDDCFPNKREKRMLPDEEEDDGFPNKREKTMLPDEEEDDGFPNKREETMLPEDDGFPNKREETMLPEDDCFPNKREETMLPDEEEDDDEQQLMLVDEDEGII